MPDKAYFGNSARISTSSNQISVEEQYDVNDVRILSYTLAAGAADQLISLNLPYANLKGISIKAEWATGLTGSNVTMKTNSSGSPAQTFTLKPNKVSQWHADSAFANPITANITALYMSNPDANPCTLKIVVGNNL